MIKKITMLIFLILFYATISFGQMVSLESTSAFANSDTSVAINVHDLNNINSLTFYIHFDQNVLDYVGISDQALPGMFAAVSGSVVTMTWYSAAASYSPNGLLCKLNFFYKGGSSPIKFLPGCEITQGATPFLVGYSNGSISQAPCITGGPSADIGDDSCSTGDIISLPINLSDFPNVGAFTQYIKYDASKLMFVSITTGGNLAGTVFNNTNGLVTLTWATPNNYLEGRNINTVPASNNKLKINFKCILPGISTVEFGPGSLFSTGLPSVENIRVCYSTGQVSKLFTTESAILGDLNGVIQGSEIRVPLDLNITGLISAFTLKLNFNAPVINFTGIELVDPLPNDASIVSNVNGNLLSIVYTNDSPSEILPGTFLKIKFLYTGMGVGRVDFGSNSEFVDGLFEVINVGFENSIIVPGIAPSSAIVKIDNVSGNYNSVVDVPLEIDGGSSNPLGAATMFIGFDPQKLSFIGAVENQYGAMVEAIGDQISIAWADTGVSLNGVFLKLRFQYNGGGGEECGSSIYFKNDLLTLQSCELADNAAAFVPASWESGGINLEIDQLMIQGGVTPGANSTVEYSTNLGMINYSWTVVGGNIVENLGDTISVTWGTGGAGSVSVACFNQGGCQLEVTKSIMVLVGNPTTNIEGFVTYDNSISSGMNGVNVSLINALGTTVSSAVTTSFNNSNGYYHFDNVPQDFYTMEISYSAPWAGTPGISALDALIVELETVGLMSPPLTGIKYAASNVDGGAASNSTDALNIKRRIVGEISSFPVGNWVFDNGVIEAFNNPVTIYNVKTLCSGDVNGSFQPVGSKSKTLFNVNSDDILTVQENKSFIYHLQSGFTSHIGAVTLYLKYDQNVVEVEEVSSILKGFQYSIKNGLITVAWSNTNSGIINIGDELFSIRMVVKQSLQEPIEVLSVKSESEFADTQTNVLNDVLLKMAKVTTSAGVVSITNYPNPFTSLATISFMLPEVGNVRYVVKNLSGAIVCTLIDKVLGSGQHFLILDAVKESLSPGVYLGTFEFETSKDKFSKVNKLIYTK